MSEDQTPENDAPEAPEVEPTEQESSEQDSSQEDENELPDWMKQKLSKANREAENLRKRLKEAEPIVAAAREAEEAQKTESQRTAEELAATRQENATLKRDKLITELASDAGLPKKFWRRVTGESQEEIAADIADLMEAFPVKDAVSLSQKPRETLRGGSRPDEPVEETDPKKIVASIPRTYQVR